ncbi:unnamed protein product [Wuchereria bancrofti]|uniref:Uncharacterized protein n=1 Tax=Wuchereria bancrofti TaxID=6293 RepID=A0A3P7DUS3_WUCBA|nr:unnamed protein product [Wuchereria bancrofti]
MKIVLTEQEKQDIFYNALCDGAGYIQGYGIRIGYDNDDYSTARDNLQSKNPTNVWCWEDVLMEVLKTGKPLKIEDIEGEGENDKTITLQDMYDNIETVPPATILNMVNEEYDATDADTVLQHCFYRELIFG